MSDQYQNEEDFSGYRILIADDNEKEREALVNTVKALGVQCDVVNDGDELITKLLGTECGTYHLVLTDIYMPGKNGYEVCHEYRSAHRKDSATLPFIGISAEQDQQLFEKAVASGMNGMAKKPPTRSALSAYFTLLLKEGKTNLGFAARIQSHLDELSRLQKELAFSDASKETSIAIEDTQSLSLMSRLKKIRLVFIVFLLLLIGFFIGIYRNSSRVQSITTETKLTYQMGFQYQAARNLFRIGTDTLTATARQFSIMGDYSQLEAYFRESHIDRHRDQSLQMMRALSYDADSTRLLEESMQNSIALMEIEYHSMKLAALAIGRSEASLPMELQNYRLTFEEKGLPPEKQREKAIHLLFDYNYITLKNKIMEGVDSSQTTAIEQNQQQFQRLAKELNFLNKLESVFMCLMLILLLGFVALMYYLYRLRLITQEKIALKDAMTARDKAIAAERAKSYFFTSVSHDIRTPLNSILGFAQLLQHGGQTEAERQDFLESIISSGKQLLGLVNDLLDMSRLEAGRLELKPAPFNVRKLIEDIVLAFRPMEHEKSLSLTTDVPAEEDFFPILDRGRLRQVLVNLVGNAFKFTKAGGIHLTLKCDKKKRSLSISVKDTGCGISPQNLGKLMKPFVQLSHMDRTNGTGLGLAISRHILELMGGTLTVASQVGKGSTFTAKLNNVTFGNEADEEKEAKSVTTKLPKKAKSLKELKVLLVDDVKMNLHVTREILKTFGITQTECAQSGKEALQKLERDTFDLILTDMRMPEMSGEELVRIIRADVRWQTVPIYGLTGDADASLYTQDFGLTGLLLKPLNLSALKEALEKCV